MKRRNPPIGSILILCEYTITTRDGSSSSGEKLYAYDKKNYTFWHEIFDRWIKRSRARSLKTLEAQWQKDAAAFNGYITHLQIQFTEIGVL